MPTQVKLIVWFVGLLVSLGLLVAITPFTVVQAGERAVVLRLGKVDRVLAEGMHFVVPMVDDVEKLDVTVQTVKISEQSYSKDGQVITPVVALNYRVDTGALAEMFPEYKREYEAKLIMPKFKDSAKSVFAKYTAQEMISNRGVLREPILEGLNSKLENSGIIVLDINVEDVGFDPAFEASIVQKQVEEQNALKQANITKQEEEKKKQEVLKAQALAEKTRLEVQALQDSAGKTIVEKILAEAQLEAAKKWNGQLPTHMYGSAPIPMLNIAQEICSLFMLGGWRKVDAPVSWR